MNIPRLSAKLIRNLVVNRAGSRRSGAITLQEHVKNVKLGVLLSK